MVGKAVLTVVYSVPPISQRNTSTDARKAQNQVVSASAPVLMPVDLRDAHEGDTVQTHATCASDLLRSHTGYMFQDKRQKRRKRWPDVHSERARPAWPSSDTTVGSLSFF